MTDLKATVLKELSTKISELIGYQLGEDHIHRIQNDGTGYHYYVQSLKPGYPVLVMHYRGPLVLMLPLDDARRLNREEISVDDYIETSHFSYGYYWGGGSMINGAYWQPFEVGTGIHDKERISRYLHILDCRTEKISSGYPPTEEKCQKCPLDATNCPFSPLNQTGSWENEVHEPDRRRELFKAINKRLNRELGFSWAIRQSHSGDWNELRLYPGWEPDTVEAYVNKDLLNDLLYHPDQDRDLEQMANDFVISIAKPFRPDHRVILPNNSTCKREICLDFWYETVKEWGDRRQPEALESLEDLADTTNEETSPGADKGYALHRTIIAAISGLIHRR